VPEERADARASLRWLAACARSVNFAGDTIFCPEVEDALLRNRPDATVVNADGARFLTGDPIVMTAEDVVRVCRTLLRTRVIAAHMEALNHCFLTSEGLRGTLQRERLLDRVAVPEDGASVCAGCS
jgi:hypothetical protein